MSQRTSAAGALSRPLKLIALVAIAALIGALASLAGCGNSAPKVGTATIRIEPGTSARDIAKMLADENVIDDEGDFMSQARSDGAATELKAGTYTIPRGASLSDIIAMLQNGIQDPNSVLTVPEGYDINDIAQALAAKQSPVSDASYQKAVQNTNRQLPLIGASGAPDLEGFLFPSTYNLDLGMTADQLVDRQLKEFSDKTGPVWADAKPNPATAGLTQYQLLIIASMIEREAKVPEERPLIAAVIYNRLARGMKLEVDATVQYALGYWKTDLTQQDLAVDSAYNTRLYAGLPPGPICNPGIDSIKAALDPAPVDYLYYVAKGDDAGHHFFTASYDEFMQAQQGN